MKALFKMAFLLISLNVYADSAQDLLNFSYQLEGEYQGHYGMILLKKCMVKITHDHALNNNRKIKVSISQDEGDEREILLPLREFSDLVKNESKDDFKVVTSFQRYTFVFSKTLDLIEYKIMKKNPEHFMDKIRCRDLIKVK